MIYYIRVHCAQLLNSGFYLFVIDQVRVEELIWITYSTGMIQYSMTELLTQPESIIHLPFLRISTSKLVLCICYRIQSPRHQQNRQHDQEVDSPPRRRIRRDLRRPVYMTCSLSSRSSALKNYRTRPLIQPATQPSKLVASWLTSSQLLGGEVTVTG